MTFKPQDIANAAPVRADGTGVIGPSGWAIWPLLLIGGFCLAALATAAPPARPPFNTVGNAALSVFRAIPGFERGDLVSRGQVAAALDAVASAGWNVPNRQKIVDRALPDGSFLLQQSATPAGKIFMRKVAKQSGGYPRLDRLSTISDGQKLIRDLINDKDGDILIEYLATTSGGKKMGEMMAQTPNGVDLNKPTGRIYTIDDLLLALAQSYTATTPQAAN